MSNDRIKSGKSVFEKEILALKATQAILGEPFGEIVEFILTCTGKVVVTGVGKSGHIAAKIASTFSSLGTPSFFLHPDEALHGDLGMISKEDIVIAISHSGESKEILDIVAWIRELGIPLIALTGNSDSHLAKFASIFQAFPAFDEACHMNLAPTSSTTAALCYGDALAVVVSEEKGFGKSDFGRIHPAGSLGKMLSLKVRDVLIPAENTNVIAHDVSIKETIIEMSKKGLTIITWIESQKIKGILTDGDIRRALATDININQAKFSEYATKNPFTIRSDEPAVAALKVLKDHGFAAMPVIDDHDHYVGIITLHSIIREGITL